jgi:hypothetical protein
LIPGGRPQYVLAHGDPGSHDEVLLYYGTVLEIGGTYHMWYNGNYKEPGSVRSRRCLCYAVSADGLHWEKPKLGLVPFRGSLDNNRVDFPDDNLWSTCAIIHEPDEPNEDRRFKMMYEALDNGKMLTCVAFSRDGFRWKLFEGNPVGGGFEMTGITKFRGMYYVNGQGGAHGVGSRQNVRRMVTYASADFERWSPCAVLSLNRSSDTAGPALEGRGNEQEEVHLGAGLWNRGNVIIGIYGQWHGHPTGDRSQVSIDLGLAISHDAVHFHEPIPDFRFIPAREQPKRPLGVGPALEQGQGMYNIGERTVYWYSLWREMDGSGVRAVSWERDRLGMMKPYAPHGAETVTGPFRVLEGAGYVSLNASGLGEYSRLRIEVLDEAFRPVPGYSEASAAVVADGGFRVPVAWGTQAALPAQPGKLRLRIRFEGVRPEDAQLHAVYISSQPPGDAGPQ